MKALQLVGPSAVEARSVDIPQIGPSEVLVRVRAAGLCETDVFFYKHADLLAAYGVSLPLTLGHEFAGEVAGVGSEVSGLTAGDRVVVEPNVTCGECPPCRSGRSDVCARLVGIGQTRNGGFAEYVIAPARVVHRLPPDLALETAALTEPVACAVHGFRRTRLRSGEDVLVIGDGFFGLLFAQVARLKRARQVAVVGHHDNRLDIARSLGADVAVDERSPEAAPAVTALGDGLGPHVIIDTVGSPASIGLALKLIMPGGRIGIFGVTLENVSLGAVALMFKAPDIIPLVGNPAVWPEALQLLQTGAVELARLVSRTVTLDDLPEAFALKASRSPDVIKVVVRNDR